MEFALSEDQVMLQDSVRGQLASASPLERVREVAAGAADVRAAIAADVAGLGLGPIVVPEAQGGLGLGLLDAVVVQEQLGAAVAPVPFLAQSVMAPVALGRCGSAAQQAGWLGRIARDEVHVAVAMTERTGAREGAGIAAGGGTVSGKALFALETEGASHVLVADTAGVLHVVDIAADGVVARPLRTIDRTRVLAELVFESAPAEALTDENQPGMAADAAISAGRLMLAADTLGAAQAMLDKAVAYSLERKQFGRVIGSFQAVKHMCAEMAAALEPARALIWHAAHAVDEGMEEAPLLVCLARAHMAEVGTFIARTATEVHGGMGFTDLVGLHYWFKRIGVNRQLLGGPEQVREEAARLQGWV